MLKRLSYEHPLICRYVSPEMSYVWSPQMKFSTWRNLWVTLASAQQSLGLEISQEQIDEMKKNVNNIDFDLAAKMEEKFKHDVMAHIHTFGEICPNAKPIIHLGATSCYVGDNTELIQIKESLCIIYNKLIPLLKTMSEFALKYKDLPTLGFTHFQPAQLTTVGKRCTLWLQDFLMDFEDINNLINDLPMRGVKGTTGTQASFLELFNGDYSKVKELNKIVCNSMGFTKWVPVSGQTYSRKWDFKIISTLSSISQSAYKMCSDLRLLASMKEIEESFGTNQIGSSAMPYKRNPMYSERICSLSRYVMGLPNSASNTHANQWFERTLDDSAIRRIILPESFLAVDTIITTLTNVVTNLQVWPAIINNHIESELPFMASEVILMQCVKAGGDRQMLHELLRKHSIEAGIRVKEYGEKNDLLDRIRKDINFSAVHKNLNDLLLPKLFIGCAPQQVEDFINDILNPVLNKCDI